MKRLTIILLCIFLVGCYAPPTKSPPVSPITEIPDKSGSAADNNEAEEMPDNLKGYFEYDNYVDIQGLSETVISYSINNFGIEDPTMKIQAIKPDYAEILIEESPYTGYVLYLDKKESWVVVEEDLYNYSPGV